MEPEPNLHIPFPGDLRCQFGGLRRNSLGQRLSTGGDFAPRGTFGNVTTGRRPCHGLQWVEARAAAKRPTTHRTVPDNNDPAQSVNSAKTVKPWSQFSRLEAREKRLKLQSRSKPSSLAVCSRKNSRHTLFTVLLT